MIRDIRSVGKELALDIVALNKKIDSRAQQQLDRMHLIDGVIKKQSERLHKVMKQYNQISHHMRKIEGTFNTVERKVMMTIDHNEGGGRHVRKSRQGSITKASEILDK
jgi:hypothetical protein